MYAVIPNFVSVSSWNTACGGSLGGIDDSDIFVTIMVPFVYQTFGYMYRTIEAATM